MVFAELLFLNERAFVEGESLYDQLMSIVEVLGTEDLHAYLKKFGITDKIKPEFEKLLPTAEPIKGKPWSDLVTDETRHLASEEAFDLLNKMLRFDYTERITPKDAMQHPYFQTK